MLHRVSNTEESQLLQKMIIEDARRELLLETPIQAQVKQSEDARNRIPKTEYLIYIYRMGKILTTNIDPFPNRNGISLSFVFDLNDSLCDACDKNAEANDPNSTRVNVFDSIRYGDFLDAKETVERKLSQYCKSGGVDMNYVTKDGTSINLLKAINKNFTSLLDAIWREQQRRNKPNYELIESLLNQNRRIWLCIIRQVAKQYRALNPSHKKPLQRKSKGII